MAIELNVNWNSEGYRADILGMLSGETQKGKIRWSTYDVFGSDFFKAKIGEIEVTVTPIDFSEENKSIKLRGKGTIIEIDADNTKDFAWRIKEIENEITSQLFKPGYFDMLKVTRDRQPEQKESLKPLKLYPNTSKGENVPALKPLKKQPTDTPHMKRDQDEAAKFKRDIAYDIAKLAKRFSKRKHCKISIKDITVEVWSDPV